MLNAQFSRLGFSEKEQSVYLALADSGRASATTLSKKTAIPRATLYSVLETLIEKGVVSREQSHGTSQFHVTSPHSFVRMIERERSVLEEKESAAVQLSEMIKPFLEGTQYTIPKLQFFEGKQSIENMLYQYLPRWRTSYRQIGDTTLWGYQDHTIVEAYQRWHQFMWETRDPQERIRLFSNSEDVEKERYLSVPRREVRALPEGVQFLSSIWIYGDYIIMCMTRRKPHYAVQLFDSVFAANLKMIFQLMWKARFDE